MHGGSIAWRVGVKPARSHFSRPPPGQGRPVHSDLPARLSPPPGSDVARQLNSPGIWSVRISDGVRC
jgi:hypothetical protein